MNEMYKRIEDLCKQNKINVTAMCRDAGVPRSALSDLKHGRTEALSTLTLGKVANFFGVSMEYLLGNEEQKKSVDQTVNGLRGLGYERLTPENQKVIDALIETLLKSQSDV